MKRLRRGAIFVSVFQPWGDLDIGSSGNMQHEFVVVARPEKEREKNGHEVWNVNRVEFLLFLYAAAAVVFCIWVHFCSV